jgi:predicted nucleic acid-binding protein
MPVEPVVIDTGPLILLAKIEALPYIAQLPHTFVVPQAVMDELAAGESLGYQQVDAPWLTVMPTPLSVPALIRVTLGAGEAAVIELAQEQNISVVCLDDLRARRMAQAAGLRPVGVLGLLAKAKRLNIIPAMTPYVERLLDVGAHYAPELVAKILREIDGQ